MPLFGVILVPIFRHSDQNNSEYGHFPRSVYTYHKCLKYLDCQWNSYCTKKWSFPWRISSVNVTKLLTKLLTHLLTKTLMENVIFLCSIYSEISAGQIFYAAHLELLSKSNFRKLKRAMSKFLKMKNPMIVSVSRIFFIFDPIVKSLCLK